MRVGDALSAAVQSGRTTLISVTSLSILAMMISREGILLSWCDVEGTKAERLGSRSEAGDRE